MLTVVLFLVGLVLVWKGADFLVDGSAGLARRFGVRTLIIGLTVVSFGTSAPELLVNLFAAARGATGLALGNVFGSNVANLLLILGLAAILGPVRAHPSMTRWELPGTLIATVLVAAMIYLPLGTGAELGRIDAVILLILFAGFLYYVYHLSKQGIQPPVMVTAMTPMRGILLVIIGIIGLGLGAHWLVTNGLILAEHLGLTQGFIGFFFIAVGTSLPEIAATVSAAKKDHLELAIGNIVGSNLFNLLFVLGATALVLPLQPDGDTPLQLASAALAPLLVFLFMAPKNRLSRSIGIVLVVLYAAWIVWLLQHIRVMP